MPAPSTVTEFLELVQKSGVLDAKKLDAYLDRLRTSGGLPVKPEQLGGLLIRDGLLTHFQAEQFLQGKWRRFTIGKYKVLERLGSGGMGSVYLCEHKLMRRRVAVKVLPTAKADDPSSLERFYREARAVAALDHPNIVRAYDIDQDDKLHFLVMEYVDGANLQEIVKRGGSMDPVRAAHYIRQAALGLQHAHEAAGLVHRDIKPGNILVDRGGTVKVLDMGLARFFHDEEDILTKKYDENVLGTADYLAPEQALDSHSVDIRADIYSLGATFYYCLTGRTPFAEGTVAQKLIWHQTRQPKPILSLRPDVPPELVAIIEKMMAKDAGQRYLTPLEVVEALSPWTQTPIPPPPDSEMPRLSLAATGGPAPSDTNLPPATLTTPGTSSPAPAPRRNWQVSAPPTSRPPSGPSGGPVALAPTATPGPTQPLRGARPAPAPAAAPPPRSTPAPQPALTPAQNGQGRPAAPRPAVEEAPPWEQLDETTGQPEAEAEATPPSGRKGSSVRSSRPRVPKPGTARERPLWPFFIGLTVLFLLGTALAVVVWRTGFGRLQQPTATQPVETPTTLSVTKDGAGRGNFRTLAAALRNVKANGRILIQVSTLEEQVQLDKNVPEGVTIEAAPGIDEVVWRTPKGLDKSSALYTLVGVRGLRLRNVTLDGGGTQDKLILLSENCPGVGLEDVHLKGFTKSAVLIMNCAGTAERPVVLKVTTTTTQEVPAAVAFDWSPSMPDFPDTKFIRFKDCRFEGHYKEPVLNKNKTHPPLDLSKEGVNLYVPIDRPDEQLQLPH